MNIRNAIESDSHPIAELHAESWRTAYRGSLSDEYLAGDVVADRCKFWDEKFKVPPQRQHILLAESNKEMIGFICLYGDDDKQWGSFLNNLHVQPQQHRHGLGTSLLHAGAESCLRAHGEGGLYLWVVQTNTKAQQFYARYGAENVEESEWNAPCGTVVPVYRFVWKSLLQLKAATSIAKS